MPEHEPDPSIPDPWKALVSLIARLIAQRVVKPPELERQPPDSSADDPDKH